MSKKNRYSIPNRDKTNYNQPEADLNAPDRIPSDEEVGEPELNINPEDNQFIPNSLVYNAYGISPTTATYRIFMKDLKEMFAKVCKSQISGVDCVTAQYDSSIGEVQFFCMFKEDCSHFDDRSMNGTMLAGEKSRYFSPEIKAFAKKFGLNPRLDCVHDKNGKIISELGKYANNDKLNADVLFVKNVDRSNNITRSYSMRLSWTTLIKLIFDKDGNAFTKQFGRKASGCNISAHFEFKKNNNGEFGSVQYLEVVKSVKGFGTAGTSRPKTSFNWREA